LGLSLGSVWAGIEAGWLSGLQSIQKTWADFLTSWLVVSMA
jgi:hypothetical protein